jgi:hypothetical protein
MSLLQITSIALFIAGAVLTFYLSSHDFSEKKNKILVGIVTFSLIAAAFIVAMISTP